MPVDAGENEAPGAKDIAEKNVRLRELILPSLLGNHGFCHSLLKIGEATYIVTLLGLIEFPNEGAWNAFTERVGQEVDTCKKELGADPAETIASMIKLVFIHHEKHQWDAAEEVKVHLETRKEMLERDHPEMKATVAELEVALRVLELMQTIDMRAGVEPMSRVLDGVRLIENTDRLGYLRERYNRETWMQSHEYPQYVPENKVDFATQPAVFQSFDDGHYEHTYSSRRLRVEGEKIRGYHFDKGTLTEKHENGSRIDAGKRIRFEAWAHAFPERAMWYMKNLARIPTVYAGLTAIQFLPGADATEHISSQAVPIGNTIAGGLSLTVAAFGGSQTVSPGLYWTFFSFWGLAAAVTVMFTWSSINPQDRERYMLLFGATVVLILLIVVAASARDVDIMKTNLQTWSPIIILLCAGLAPMVCKKIGNPTS